MKVTFVLLFRSILLLVKVIAFR